MHNPRIARVLRFLTVCAGLLLCSTQASAERWYRVELLVFSQRGGELAEQWPATPELAYPAEGRFLASAQELNLDMTNMTQPENTGDSGEEYLGTLPPFVMLGNERKAFNDTASTMARSGRYKILFHETWVQPVAAKREALPLILDRSGDTQQWPPLQGSIKLWLSRYLHLETNLWLNTGGEYLQGDWRMPAPPLGPVAAVDESGAAVIAPPAEPAPENDTATVDSTNLYWLEQEETPQVLEPRYPYRHAIALQQKRRMRSKEIHYIDHPMLGLIIKLTPLETEETSPLNGG